MKIIIYSPTSTIFNLLDYSYINSTPEFGKTGMGGADACLFDLRSTLLQLNIDVVSSWNVMYRDETNKIYHFSDINNYQSECDILIMYRKLSHIPPGIKCKKIWFYSQDTADSNCFEGKNKLGFNSEFNNFDRIIVLSEFHKNNLIENFKIDKNKIDILGNPVRKYNYTRKKKREFLYCSAPYRGLVVLLKIWKQLSRIFPGYKLHICSSMQVYNNQWDDKLIFGKIFSEIKNTGNIKYHGAISKSKVFLKMLESYILLYPNTFPETYCNVIMECRAAKLPFVTSDRGALKETGGRYGLYIQGNPYSSQYQNKFVTAVLDIDKEYQKFSDRFSDNSYFSRIDYLNKLKRLISNG